MKNIALHIDHAIDRDVVLKCYSNEPWYDRDWGDKMTSMVDNMYNHHPVKVATCVAHIHGTVKSKITSTIVEPQDPLYIDLVA